VAKVWTAEPEAKSATPQAQAEEAWRQAGRLLEQGRNHDAQARLETALRLDPGHSDARQSLIALVLEAGDAARAESLLREGQTQHPNDVWYPRSLAQLQMQRGEYAAAAAILKAALQNAAGRQRDGRKNADAPDWALYAGTLAKLGQVEESAAAYREALRRDAGQGAWWVGLGVVLEQAGQPGQASEAYARAAQTRVSVELREYAAQRLRALK
jgi:MSHA biogenesis protein MshN